MKKEKSEVLGDTKLGLEKLYKKFFPSVHYNGTMPHKISAKNISTNLLGHKGLLDAENLRCLFTETDLKEELSSLRKSTYNEIYANWFKNKIKKMLESLTGSCHTAMPCTDAESISLPP